MKAILSLGISLFVLTAYGQVFNDRISVQGYLKSGSSALNDSNGFPMKFMIKKNSTVVWCQTSAANVPVVNGVFTNLLSGASNCQSLSNTLDSSVMAHSANSDTFSIDVSVDVGKDGFGGADDASFAGIDLVPVPLAINAHRAEVASSATTLSGTVALANGGTGATTAAGARTALGLGDVAVLNSSGNASDVLLGNGTFGSAPAQANFSGNLVGDVTGTQGATVVSKVRGRTVANTAPSNGQVLAWNNSTTQWEPQTPASAPVTSVAGRTGAVTIASVDVTDATNANTASTIVERDASGNFSAGTITASGLVASSLSAGAGLTVSSASGSTTTVGNNGGASVATLQSGTGGINVAVTGTTGNISITPGTSSGTVTVGNASTGTTLIGNTGAGAVTTVRSPTINIGLTGTATTTTVGVTTGASSTVVQAGTGKVKLGSTGGAFTAMGACTVGAAAISTTATAYTCTGVPASTAVAVSCSAAAAFTTPGTTALYCRANGTVNSITCNTTAANAVSTTYNCMWVQP